MNAVQDVNKGLVSVIMPTYNRAEFIEDAVQSVFDQDYDNWELFIVDDGSTDNTRELLERFISDSRVDYSYQENAGQSTARRKAIERASGEFIAFLDSDNIWVPNRLSLGIQAMADNSDCAVSYGDIISIDDAGKVISLDNMSRHEGRIVDKLLMDNFVTMNTTLTRIEAIRSIGNVDNTIRRADDYDLWLRLSANHHFKYIPEKMVKYRIMDDQISSNKDKRFESNELIIRRFLNEYADSVSFFEKRRGLGAFFARKSEYQATMGRTFEMFRDATFSILQYPFWGRPWRVLAKSILGHYR